MILLAVKNFVRSGGVRIGLLFLLVAGLASLLVGHQFLNRQQTAVADARAFQQKDFRRSAAVHSHELGLLLYYLKFSLVNETSPLSGLSIGQRDVNASVQSVTIRALEGQKYDADLTNPTNQLLGNLDFSFVLIYLFPLLIIAFTYNIISEEKESGTWRIVAVQSNNLLRFVGQLFLIRLLTLLGLLLILLALAVPLLGIAPDASFGLFLATSVLYVLFWFGVSVWVASLQQRSSVNAMLLLGIWLGLVVVLPAIVNTYITTRYPVPEALATTLAQRKGYHEKWDMDRTQTMTRFYAHYPQFKHNPVPDSGFSWLWYYAMQQLGDDESATQADELKARLLQREAASRTIARFIPTLHTQLQLNDLARSGLGNQLRFLDYTSRFHEKKRLYFYPKLINNAPVSAERWDAFPVETFTDRAPVGYVGVLAPLLLFILGLAGFGWVNLSRSVYRL
ncbi:ABC-2 type transport system permease protein [Spirosoma lacussanchae]|uniref:DUF3526 domain-containing protein n=1 Tax=Spirosoma lacussanchae TaxID=1884249 RepID=UPI001108F670|nr:DUF3526 domain-containing protein [Spirosoma lacussanchae]